MNLKDKINTFPKTPGIYLMKDKHDNIIYVGKSKKLQDRIKSYFVNSKNHSRKVQRMVKGIHDIEIINTDTELDALLLECEYIKKIKPMYNVLMKNHENYSYIKIDTSKDYPYLEVVGEIDDDSVYFGPYSRHAKLEYIKDILNENYKLRKCKNMNKCFNYDLGRCLGPCRDNISNKEYNDKIQRLISDLKGDRSYIFDILNENMKKEINNLNFEKAAIIKEDIDKIKSLLNKQEVINDSLDDKNIIAWIDLDEFNYKVYVINKGKVLVSEIIKKDIFDNIDKERYLDDYIRYNTNYKIDKTSIDKYDIDFINIVYNYIKYNKDIKFIDFNNV